MLSYIIIHIYIYIIIESTMTVADVSWCHECPKLHGKCVLWCSFCFVRRVVRKHRFWLVRDWVLAKHLIRIYHIPMIAWKFCLVAGHLIVAPAQLIHFVGLATWLCSRFDGHKWWVTRCQPSHQTLLFQVTISGLPDERNIYIYIIKVYIYIYI